MGTLPAPLTWGPHRGGRRRSGKQWSATSSRRSGGREQQGGQQGRRGEAQHALSGNRQHWGCLAGVYKHPQSNKPAAPTLSQRTPGPTARSRCMQQRAFQHESSPSRLGNTHLHHASNAHPPAEQLVGHLEEAVAGARDVTAANGGRQASFLKVLAGLHHVHPGA